MRDTNEQVRELLDAGEQLRQLREMFVQSILRRRANSVHYAAAMLPTETASVIRFKQWIVKAVSRQELPWMLPLAKSRLNS